MKTLTRRQVSTGLFFIAAFASCLTLTHDSQLRNHYRIRTEITETRRGLNRLGRHVLELRSNLNWSYDALAIDEKALQKDLDDLSVSLKKSDIPGRAELLEKLQQVRLEMQGEFDTTERFKSHHSIVRNSKYYLPTAYHQAVAAEKPGPILLSLQDLLPKVFKVLNGGSSQERAQLCEEISKLQGMAKGHPEALNFLSHALVVVRRDEEFEAKLAQLTSRDDFTSLAQLEASYNHDYANYVRSKELLKLVLFLLFVLAMGLLGWAVANLNRTFRQLHTLNEELEARVAERTQTLEEANRLLALEMERREQMQKEMLRAQRLESLGHLAAGVAHEINTPLQFLSDNLTFLQDSFNDILPALDSLHPETSEALDTEFLNHEIPDAIQQSQDGLKRVVEIVKSLRNFSHPGTAVKENADINELVRNALTVSRNEYRYVARLEVDLDESLPPSLCYPGELGQVILNLVVNAAHAIKCKGDQDPTKEKILVSTRSVDGKIEIKVSDTGPGIPEEIRSKVFDAFFTTKEVGKGTGQGLNISYDIIVNKHSGTIDFETECGRGTSFTLQLPAPERLAA